MVCTCYLKILNLPHTSSLVSVRFSDVDIRGARFRDWTCLMEMSIRINPYASRLMARYHLSSVFTKDLLSIKLCIAKTANPLMHVRRRLAFCPSIVCMHGQCGRPLI